MSGQSSSRAAALALVVGLLAGCPRGATTRPIAGDAADGLAVAIYTGVAAAAPAATAAANQPINADLRAAVPPPVVQPQPQPQPAPVPAPAPPPPRVSVALVDDRRAVEVDGDGGLRLPELADGIALASLIIDPLDGGRFVVKSCARPRVTDQRATLVTESGVEVTGRLTNPSGDGRTWIVEDDDGHTHLVRGAAERVAVPGSGAREVRCDVDAEPGRHRVRLTYATSDLSWQASYRIDVAARGDGAATATVQPTYTIAGSGVIGARHATVSLLVGLPGGADAPRLAWQGRVDLGSDAVAVQPPARVVAARLDHVYRGAIATPDEQPRSGNYWRATSTPDVWVVLAVAAGEAAKLADLPGGAALFWITRDDVTRQAQARWPEPDPDARGVDVRLWPSTDLVGFRERRVLWDDGTSRLVEQYLFSVANQGSTPAVVVVEEELRPGAASREIRKPWPNKPERRGDVLRSQVRVAPGAIERLGFEAEYRW